MRAWLWVAVFCLSFLLAGCGKRMVGTYEGDLAPMSVPNAGMDLDERAQGQSIEPRRQGQSKVRLKFEGRRKARINNWGGMELVVPYRVKKERVELLLGEGESEQVLTLTINADGSLQGLPGRLVKVE